MVKNPKGAGRKRKLTPLEELELYKLYKGGEGITNLVIKFCVSSATVVRVVNRIDEMIIKK